MVSDMPGTRGVQVTTELNSNAAISKTLPPIQFSSYDIMTFAGSTAQDGEKYTVSPVPTVSTGLDME
jgi:hypothetical protein